MILESKYAISLLLEIAKDEGHSMHHYYGGSNTRNHRLHDLEHSGLIKFVPDYQWHRVYLTDMGRQVAELLSEIIDIMEVDE